MRIAVEVKTFAGPSEVTALEQAVGQHVIYRALLAARDPGRLLFLSALDRVVCFDPVEERIIQWTPPPSGET